MLTTRCYYAVVAVSLAMLTAALPVDGQLAAIEKQLGHTDLTYQADMIYDDGNTAVSGRVFRAPGRERWEFEIEGQTLVAIIHAEEERVWLLMPALRIYSSTTLDDPLVSGLLPLPAGDRRLRITVDGPATVGGMATTRHRLYGVTSAGELYEGLMWVSDDGVVVRAEAAGEGSMSGPRLELMDIRFVQQPASLFSLPRDYSVGKITPQLVLATPQHRSASGELPGTKVEGGRDVLRVESEGEVVEVDRETIEEGAALLGRFLGKAWRATQEGSRDVVTCRPGRDCRVGSNAFATLRCTSGDCDMTCGSTSNCIFECPEGGCRITCGSTSKCEIDCPHGCDVACGGLAKCSGDW